jgi:hypothetical protein
MPKSAASLPGVGDVAARLNEIESLQAQIRTHLDSIDDLYARIARTAAGSAAGRGKARGRPRKRAAVAVVRRGRKRRGRVARKAKAAGGPRKRAKRGALKAAIHGVLGGGKVLGCSQIVAALRKAKYQTASTPGVFYNTVYLALKKDGAVEKTKDGFRLKAAG